MGIMRSDRHDLIANYDNSGMKLLRDQDVGTTAGMTMATQEKRNCNLIVDYRCVSVEEGKESKTSKVGAMCPEKASGCLHVSAIGKAILGVQERFKRVTFSPGNKRRLMNVI